MESALDFISTPLLGLFALLCTYYIVWMMPKKIKEAPQPAGGWPIIGHLHVLGRGEVLQMALGGLADKYGPIFMVRLGLKRALVVSNWEIVKECFTLNDKNLSNRPSGVALKLMGFNNAMFGFAQYGPYWRELRKIVIQEILSSRRLESLKHVWDSEILTSIKELFQVCANQNKTQGGGEVLIEMNQWFEDLTLNIAVRMVAGKRYFGTSAGGDRDEARKCQKAIRDFFRFVGSIVVSDVLPFLGWLDIGGHEKEMKRTARELDFVLQGWLDEHKLKRQSGGGSKEDRDFMDVMMSILDDSKLITDFDVDTINKATCFNIVVGATDTTMATLGWALSLLLNNPDVLKKAQAELDNHIGKDRQVDQADIKKLPYLEAILKETLRFYPVAPIIPRETMEDCIIGDYPVRAKTQVIINTWKIQRDPSIWTNPCEFQPERFLVNKDRDFRGLNFEFIPFGSGRRMCPGISLGMDVVSLSLARLLHGFELKTQSGCKVDMTENVNSVNAKATPLEVLVTPRLYPNLYE